MGETSSLTENGFWLYFWSQVSYSVCSKYLFYIPIRVIAEYSTLGCELCTRVTPIQWFAICTCSGDISKHTLWICSKDSVSHIRLTVYNILSYRQSTQHWSLSLWKVIQRSIKCTLWMLPCHQTAFLWTPTIQKYHIPCPLLHLIQQWSIDPCQGRPKRIHPLRKHSINHYKFFGPFTYVSLHS